MFIGHLYGITINNPLSISSYSNAGLISDQSERRNASRGAAKLPGALWFRSLAFRGEKRKPHGFGFKAWWLMMSWKTIV